MILLFQPPGQLPVAQPVVYAAGHTPVMVIPSGAPIVYPPPQGMMMLQSQPFYIQTQFLAI